jgi:hypothetical protein
VAIERLRIVNRQLADAKLQLDQLCKKLAVTSPAPCWKKELCSTPHRNRE